MTNIGIIGVLLVGLVIGAIVGSCAAEEEAPANVNVNATDVGELWTPVGKRSYIRAIVVNGTRCMLLATYEGVAIDCNWAVAVQPERPDSL